MNWTDILKNQLAQAKEDFDKKVLTDEQYELICDFAQPLVEHMELVDPKFKCVSE